MKLISCYIENFGGLSKFSLNFDEKITVVEEPNGFGKTTLAEFIRAMFYGFPHGSTNLQKNIRKKYLPWQGGNYGGNLIFENEGKKYKIERSFGDKPRLDSFNLFDLKTNKKTNDYSSNIGVELFGIDSDSFVRSTYLPQIIDSPDISTDSIRAKLGDLIEDTNDINNFDSAISKLKDKRTYFQAYRGNGGKINQLTTQISNLQEEVEGIKNSRTDLENKKKELLHLKELKQDYDKKIRYIRLKINTVSEATAKSTLTKQYGEKLKKKSEDGKAFAFLEEKFNSGIPSDQDIKLIEPLYDKVIELDKTPIETSTDIEDKKIIELGDGKFVFGVPKDEEFNKYKDKCKLYAKVNLDYNHESLNDTELAELSELRVTFKDGIPKADLLDEIQNKIDLVKSLNSKKESLVLSNNEENLLNNLKSFFVAGVPTQEDIKVNQEKVQKIDKLKAENVDLAAKQVSTVQEVKEESPKKNSSLIFFVLGGVVSVVGLVLLLMGKVALGGVLLGIGVLVLGFGIYSNIKNMVKSELANVKQSDNVLSESDQNKIRDNGQRIKTLEQEVLNFVSRYISDGRSLADKLRDIENKSTDYANLLMKKEENDQKQESFLSEIEKANQEILRFMNVYFDSDDSDDFLTLLNLLKFKINSFEKLSSKFENSEIHKEELMQQMEKLSSEIVSFLSPYYDNVLPSNFDSYLDKLKESCQKYSNAKKRVSAKQQQRDSDLMELNECQKKVKKFNAKYNLNIDLKNRSVFQNLCRDIENYNYLKGQIDKDTQDLEAFYKENQRLLDAPDVEITESLEDLKATESSLNKGLSQNEESIAKLNQEIKPMQNRIDGLSGKLDELDIKQTKKFEMIHKVDILDKTIDYLNDAKESLSSNYSGRIKNKFAEYLGKISGEDKKNILITSDLKVQMERMGESRELGYFSAGQSDLIMLCMRFALVDALFEDSKPFIILDDPFVNLDDENTKKALSLLNEISKSYQIVYLVCNSSRTI